MLSQGAGSRSRMRDGRWGIAYAAGPNYNKPWEAFDEDDAKRSLRTAFDATTRAEGLSGPATETEKALIRALRRRYPSPIPAADMCPWNDEYAAAMRTVHEEHGNDPDVAALFAEAMMNRTPWALWELESGAVAPGADTAEAIVVLEAAMRRRRDRGEAPHAGLLHMYIHCEGNRRAGSAGQPRAVLRDHRDDAVRDVGRTSARSETSQRRSRRPPGSRMRCTRSPRVATCFNNTCVDILAIAREMMLGEFAYRRGDHRDGVLALAPVRGARRQPRECIRGFYSLYRGIADRAPVRRREPAELPRAGICWPRPVDNPGLADLPSGRRTSPWRRLVFYRALVQADNIAPVRALVEALPTTGSTACRCTGRRQGRGRVCRGGSETIRESLVLTEWTSTLCQFHYSR